MMSKVEEDAKDINATHIDDYDAAYKKHFENAQRAKLEYEQLYKEMVDKLSITHLEPFATTLKEVEQRTLLDQEEIVKVLSSKLLSKLLQSFHHSWEACDVSNRLATLSILKERFKDYEGHNWHIQDMPPKQRLLPLRIRYKENSKRYLQKQIQHQNAKLEELIRINSVQRARIKEVTNHRVYLKEAMERESVKLLEKKQKLAQLQEEMLRDSSDDDDDL